MIEAPARFQSYSLCYFLTILDVTLLIVVFHVRRFAALIARRISRLAVVFFVGQVEFDGRDASPFGSIVGALRFAFLVDSLALDLAAFFP